MAAGKLYNAICTTPCRPSTSWAVFLGRCWLGAVAEVDVAQALAEQLQLPWLRAEDFPNLLPEVPGLQSSFLEAQCVYPIALNEGVLQVAMAVPQDALVPPKPCAWPRGCKLHPALALEADIRKALADAQEEQATDDTDENGWSGSASGGDLSNT